MLWLPKPRIPPSAQMLPALILTTKFVRPLLIFHTCPSISWLGLQTMNRVKGMNRTPTRRPTFCEMLKVSLYGDSKACRLNEHYRTAVKWRFLYAHCRSVVAISTWFTGQWQWRKPKSRVNMGIDTGWEIWIGTTKHTKGAKKSFLFLCALCGSNRRVS